MYLGIEFGSTRIKSVLIDENFAPVAVGNFNWENRLEGGLWTYHEAEIRTGLQASYADLVKNYGKPLTKISRIGISAMMHGYIPLCKNGTLLSPFRTWRNTNTGEAAEILRESFGHNIPLRWSVAHLYQAVLDGERHLENIDFLATLAVYVHYKLTGERVAGVGDASGMFPIDCEACDYNADMIEKFDALAAEKSFTRGIKNILPRVLSAGENAGQLTPEGAKLLDPSGVLQPGAFFCPPEGDAGTGMAATNSVTPLTGNVSSGTSIFAMVVLEKPLSRVYPEIDIVTTPDGKPVAMVHCNNGTSDLDAWVRMFAEIISAHTGAATTGDLYETLYKSALTAAPDGGGLMACNYLSGEHNTGFREGRPLFMRLPNSSLTMPNFMRTMLFSVMATLKLGMGILEREGVALKKLNGHGGFFKTEGVGRQLMAGALNVPVSVQENAGEGGAWGIALLAAYVDYKNLTLPEFLQEKVFAALPSTCKNPDPSDVKGFADFMEGYRACLAVERAAVDNYRRP